MANKVSRGVRMEWRLAYENDALVSVEPLSLQDLEI